VTDPHPGAGDTAPGSAPGAGSSSEAGSRTGPDPTADRGPTTDPELPAAVSGPALARAVLDAAQRRRARRQGEGRGGETTPAGESPGARNARTLRRRWSGPGPDSRDPQLFGAVLARLVKARGWQRPTAEATLFGRWEHVVGSEVADHCRPVKLERGELTIEAESTAWATQLRLLAGSLLKQIAGEVGHGIVTRLRIHGPAAPSWYRGPRRVRGRGPRDTYG